MEIKTIYFAKQSILFTSSLCINEYFGFFLQEVWVSSKPSTLNVKFGDEAGHFFKMQIHALCLDWEEQH